MRDNFRKIENGECIYCDGKLVDTREDHKSCSVCESTYWYRDTGPGYWQMKESEKRIKERISLEFRDIISHSILGTGITGGAKEDWNNIFDRCADYAFKLLTP